MAAKRTVITVETTNAAAQDVAALEEYLKKEYWKYSKELREY